MANAAAAARIAPIAEPMATRAMTGIGAIV
jgi:hypothetical protein